MPTVEQLRSRLIGKLKELFQLDQPDLDFGFYRIMHAKSREVNTFLEDTLPRIIADSFGGVSGRKQTELQAAYEQALQTARDFGAPDPEAAEPVKKAKAALEAAGNTANDEAEVYDHLYRFFERYYDNGDFVSLRYLTRETDHKAKPYAAPYGGEEVMLHWANSDQYYIKTAENFSNFTFDLTQAKEFRDMSAAEKVLNNVPDHALKVHFKIVEAEEGEHGNIKSGGERFFLIHRVNPVEFIAAPEAELTVYFEYRDDPEKTGQANAWRGKRNREATAAILERLDAMDGQRLLHAYRALLAQPIPTDTDKDRVMLDRYIERYTRGNSSDYFIHKDLGGFLKRELDFYLKNEIMQLDNIVHQEAPAVESYLGKLKVLRKIATELIEFLAQLENFQKKLWLKKKFVIQCDYCITLDRIPAELLPEVLANRYQWEEWQKLGLVENIIVNNHDHIRTFRGRLEQLEFAAGDVEYLVDLLTTPPQVKTDYKAHRVNDLFRDSPLPQIVDFTKIFAGLMVDTKFFAADFKARLLAAIPDLDEKCDGLLIHSENFQALNLLQERYREQVKCIYIDPPYNTGNDEFIYKDSYQFSSWYSMMLDRILLAKEVLQPSGLFSLQIGDQESAHSRILLETIFEDRKNSAVVRRGIKNVQAQFDDIDKLSLGHDIIHICSKTKDSRLPHLQQQLLAEKAGKWDTFWRGTDRPSMRYELLGKTPTTGQWRWESGRAKQALANYNYYTRFEEKDKSLDEWWAENFQSGVDLDFVRKNEDNVVQYYVPPQNFRLVSDNWLDIPAAGSETDFAHEKSTLLLRRIIYWNTQENDIVLDFFAGSGSTGIATFRADKRKYILMEMGDHFNNILKPRIEKVVFSPEWKDELPTAGDQSISHCFKYMRLESYEDTLNNLEFSGGEAFGATPELARDHLLHYMLDVESRDSASLLNIRAFDNPFDYKLQVKKPGSEESELRSVDLLETFNYLLGLRVRQIFAPQRFAAEFERLPDPELPQDQRTRLTLKGRLRLDGDGKWLFRKVEGLMPKNRFTPNDGLTERVLIVWRTLTGDLEQDNLVLDEFLKRECVNVFDGEFDTVYVNGSNNVPNLRRDQDQWKVRLIEEDFMSRMWEGA